MGFTKIWHELLFSLFKQLRVSSTLSNAPYILVLDCDMYCNDSISARQSMCFHLDPRISPTLGWVQYPQKFYAVNETDVYDSEMKSLWLVSISGSYVDVALYLCSWVCIHLLSNLLLNCIIPDTLARFRWSSRASYIWYKFVHQKGGFVWYSYQSWYVNIKRLWLNLSICNWKYGYKHYGLFKLHFQGQLTVINKPKTFMMLVCKMT